MQESSVFHEDVFYEYFRPFRHPSASFNIWGGHGLETFGDDLKIVKDYAQEFVWTVVDGSDDSDQWILPGDHHINRICYLLTEVPHNDAPVEFHVENRHRLLTPLGLARRISTLRKILLRSHEGLIGGNLRCHRASWADTVGSKAGKPNDIK